MFKGDISVEVGEPNFPIKNWIFTQSAQIFDIGGEMGYILGLWSWVMEVDHLQWKIKFNEGKLGSPTSKQTSPLSVKSFFKVKVLK